MKAVIFDLDGVIVDSMWVWDRLSFDYLDSLGYKAYKNINEDLISLSLEEGYIYLKEKHNMSESVEEIQKGLEDTLKDYYKYELELKNNVREVLEYLKKRDYKLCIGTATKKDLANIILKKYKLLDYFLFIETEIKYKKTEEEYFRNICKKLEVDYTNTYLIEDSIAPIETANKVGINTIGVYDKRSNKDDDNFKEVSDYYVKDLQEVMDIL